VFRLLTVRKFPSSAPPGDLLPREKGVVIFTLYLWKRVAKGRVRGFSNQQTEGFKLHAAD
jgi:hypothetical protein